MCEGNNKLVEQKYGYEPVKNCLLEIMKWKKKNYYILR
jgi:hypothetical protein